MNHHCESAAGKSHCCVTLIGVTAPVSDGAEKTLGCVVMEVAEPCSELVLKAVIPLMWLREDIPGGLHHLGCY